jgi:uncharacterized membrane protein YeaQ/YmgE (transglycosylase-associated protein family)
MGILSWIVVGLIAGWLAGVVMKGGGFGILWDIIIGIAGAILGGFIASYFFKIGGVSGINLTSIVIAFLGAVLIIIIARAIRR